MSTPTVVRRPDAILCPRNYPPTKGKEDRDIKRNKVLGAVFGTPRVTSIARVDSPPPGESFVWPCPGPLTSLPKPTWQTLYFDKGHPLEGEHRYEWFVAVAQPDGSFLPGKLVEGDPSEEGRVKLGYLRDDPIAGDEAATAAARSEWEKAHDEYVTSAEYREDMKRRGIVLFSDPNAAQTEAEIAANPPAGPTGRF